VLHSTCVYYTTYVYTCMSTPLEELPSLVIQYDALTLRAENSQNTTFSLRKCHRLISFVLFCHKIFPNIGSYHPNRKKLKIKKFFFEKTEWHYLSVGDCNYSNTFPTLVYFRNRYMCSKVRGSQI
jgi:hypothetical protein